MPSPNKPQIKNAIVECFLFANQKQLDFGDINFLLSNKPLKRFPTKEKKKLYKKWEKTFKTQFKKWVHPLKIYKSKTSYLSKMLTELIKENILIKTNGHYELTDFGYIKSIRDREKNRMDFYYPFTIAHLDNLTFYGFIPFTQGYMDGFDNEIISLKNQMEKIRKKFDKIEKLLTKLNFEQVEFLLSAILHNIEYGNFKEKEKKLALLFLKKMLSDPVYSDYKWYETKDKTILKIGNHKLDNQLSQYIANALKIIVNFYDFKPVVFTPTLTEKDKISFYQAIDDFVKKIS
jgi:hypothetical protein